MYHMCMLTMSATIKLDTTIRINYLESRASEDDNACIDNIYQV